MQIGPDHAGVVGLADWADAVTLDGEAVEVVSLQKLHVTGFCYGTVKHVCVDDEAGAALPIVGVVEPFGDNCLFKLC